MAVPVTERTKEKHLYLYVGEERLQMFGKYFILLEPENFMNYLTKCTEKHGDFLKLKMHKIIFSNIYYIPFNYSYSDQILFKRDLQHSSRI